MHHHLVLLDSPLPPTARCDFIALWHPTSPRNNVTGNDKPTTYALVRRHGGGAATACQLLEGVRLDEPERKSGSWFVDDNVVQDGGMIMFVQADPKLVVLPDL